MNVRRRGAVGSPNAHKRKEASKAGNPVTKKSDTHAMDYKRVPGKPDYEGSGKLVGWSK